MEVKSEPTSIDISDSCVADISLLVKIINILSIDTLSDKQVLLLDKYILSLFKSDFWNSPKWKDGLSYSFTRRQLPCVEQKELDKEKEESSQSGSRTRTETETETKERKKKRKNYNVDFVRFNKLINVEYVDEGLTHLSPTNEHLYKVVLSEHYNQVNGFWRNMNDLVSIFDRLIVHNLTEQMIKLYCYLCTSHMYCHYALNNQHILKYMQPIFAETSKPAFANVAKSIFYGFYLMYKEECIRSVDATDNCRFVIDLRNAHLLPSFNLPYHQTPYIPLTLSNKYLYSLHVPNDQKIVKPLVGSWSVVDMNMFRRRFNVFTSGIFKKINWQNIYISGSTITACCICNPLEQLFDSFDDYLEEYYPSKKCLKKHINGENHRDKLSDIDIMIDLTDDLKFTCKVIEIFDSIKEITGDSSIDLQFIETKKSFKYKIVGDTLQRSVELFRIYSHPMGIVSRFHFPVVRGYYDGRNVKLLPSFVSAAKTGINIDYKWFSSNKSPRELILKLFSRGFATLLNSTEHEIINDVKNSQPWKYIDLGRNTDPFVSVNNIAFKPRSQRAGIHFNLPSTLGNYMYIAQSDKEKDKFAELIKNETCLRYPSGFIKPPDLN